MRRRLSSIETPSISCSMAGHNQQEVIHLCCTNDCMTPLCPDCVQIHKEYHDDANESMFLKPLKEAQLDTYVKLTDTIRQVERKLRDFQNVILESKSETLSDLEHFTKYRTYLIALINNHFDKLEQDYKRLAEQDQKRRSTIFDATSKELTTFIAELTVQKDNLLGCSESLRLMKELYLKDFDQELERRLSKFSIGELESKGCKIVSNSSMMAAVTKLLQENVRVEATRLSISKEVFCSPQKMKESSDVLAASKMNSNSGFDCAQMETQEKSNEGDLKIASGGNEGVVIGKSVEGISCLLSRSGEKEEGGDCCGFRDIDRKEKERQERAGKEEEEEEKDDSIDDDIEILTQQTIYSDSGSKSDLDVDFGENISCSSEQIPFEEEPESRSKDKDWLNGV